MEGVTLLTGLWVLGAGFWVLGVGFLRFLRFLKFLGFLKLGMYPVPSA
jgi:hypothetical protein